MAILKWSLAVICAVRDVAYRENVAREIFQTEKDYVNNLTLLLSVFINPIKENLTDHVWKPKNGSKSGEVPNQPSCRSHLI